MHEYMFKQHRVKVRRNFKELEIGELFVERYSTPKSACKSREDFEKENTIYKKVNKTYGEVFSSPNTAEEFTKGTRYKFAWNGVITRLDDIEYATCIRSFYIYFENNEIKTCKKLKDVPDKVLFRGITGSDFRKKFEHEKVTVANEEV